MELEIEWRIPWDATWDDDKKKQAADKLASYVNEGTMFSITHRMMARAEVKTAGKSPYLLIRMER